MIFRVEVSLRDGLRDARGENIRRQAGLLGIPGIEGVTVSDLYFLECAGSPDKSGATAARLAEDLLCDPVVEQMTLLPVSSPAGRREAVDFVEVALRPGVTDSVAESLQAAATTAGIAGLLQAASGRSYAFRGAVAHDDLRLLAERLLANAVIQTFAVNAPVAPPFVPAREPDGAVETIALLAADSARLAAISRERRLALDVAEMAAIQEYYRGEGRDPTDLELEMLAQTWSEHCVHKTFKALVDYEERTPDGAPVPGSRAQIDSLLKTYIRAATEAIAAPWVHSAFVDNAGIVAFDEGRDLAFKVETHNHPSALEPFGGANTGVGGVVRDVIGVSARPIANTDVLCFGPADTPLAAVPGGVQHPRRIADGVIAGIEDYGNKMGIPTVNGAILYDPGYTANPLVFCGCLGILPEGSHRNTPAAGDLVVVLGGRTGRDGLRGATFSSMEMDHETGQVAGSAVQIGHPIHEKQVLEAVIAARDAGLYSAITDCGAGGLSSAIGEMAAELGAEIHLERVPLKYPGLRPWEIWLSEAQERMVLAVPPAAWDRLAALCSGLDVEAMALGHFTGDGCLALSYDGQLVGRVATEFLHNGIPRRRLAATWTPPLARPDGLPEFVPCEMRRLLLALLAQPDTRSKEDVVRRYDHEVQGATVAKPFVGPLGSGPADAAVLSPFRSPGAEPWADEAGGATPPRGAALAAGINPHYGLLDPYAMAWAAVDEAVRNCVAVGADPAQVALLDNFCWGNPNLPDRLGSLVRCAQGCHDAALAYRAPYISGKDSLNNEYTGADGQKHAIPGTLLISALALVPDIACTVTSDFKTPGDWLYLAGTTLDELGGSALARLQSWDAGRAGRAPQPKTDAPALYAAVHRAMASGLVRACHDPSEGGLVVAAAEMALGGQIGLDLDLNAAPQPPGRLRPDVAAFSESLGRLLLEVAPGDAAAFEEALGELPFARVGELRADGSFKVWGGDDLLIDATLSDLDRAWRGHLA